MKFAKRDRCAVALADIMTEAWQWPALQPLHDADFLLPMPTGRWRKIHRGFNQAELIAEVLAPALNIPLLNGVLRRRSFDTSQTQFGAWQRALNVQGAFSVTQPERIRDRKVILIDDVWTTGATLNEATDTLMGHGAKCVYAYTAAYDIHAESRTAALGW